MLQNAYAIIEYHDEESVERALKQAEHVINEKHVKVRHRVNKEFVPKVVNKVDKKKELLEKMKKEAIALNVVLSNCDTVSHSKFRRRKKMSQNLIFAI